MDMSVDNLKDTLIQLLQENQQTFEDVEFSDYIELLKLIYLIINNKETDEDILSEIKDSIILALSNEDKIINQLNSSCKCSTPQVDVYDYQTYFSKDNDRDLPIEEHTYSFLRFFPYAYFKSLNPKYDYRDGEFFQ